MTDILYTDQSADMLRLSVVNGDVNEESLLILCKDNMRVTFPGIDKYFIIQIGIIGASHFLKLKKAQGDTLLTEILACIELHDINNCLVHSVQHPKAVSFIIDNFSYTFYACTYNWEKGEQYFNTLLSDTECSTIKNRIGLSYIFPNNNDTLFEPITAMYAQICTNGVCIKTMHAYPNEDSIVFTETNITTNTNKCI